MYKLDEDWTACGVADKFKHICIFLLNYSFEFSKIEKIIGEQIFMSIVIFTYTL